MKNKLARALSLITAGVVMAGVVAVAGDANASVTNCPSFSGRADLNPWLKFIIITPFEQHTFISAELASSTTTTCTYRGTELQEAQAATPFEFPSTEVFKKTELNPDGTVLKPPFVG